MNPTHTYYPSLLSPRRLGWDEENRLTSYNKGNVRAFYRYDAQGERFYKNTGDTTAYGNPTLYASPYLVATKYGYTKHYYAENERLLCKIGDGTIDGIDLHVVDTATLARKQTAVNQTAPNDQYTSLLSNLATLDGTQGKHPELYWQHSDHLGSASWITDTAGRAIQHLQYMPWGEPLLDYRNPSSSYSARYTFSGKERDEETGYSYFGARYYNSSYSIWMSVDPMANKYPSLSPYVYCGNNPVKLVDPSGEEIWIIGVDGSNIHYSQGMNYSGKDESVLNKINSLNQMNSTKNGEKLLGKLTTSKNVYAIVDKSCDNIKEAYYCANDLSNGKAGGTIVTQGDNSLKTLSHELFHAFQDEKGQGRASIHNEVEAMLFETSVLADYAYNNSEGYPSSALLGDNDYYNSIVSGLLNDFSTAGMNNVIRDFKSQSRANIGGTYNNYPLRQRNQSNNLIQDFYPLLPWKK